MSTITNFAQLKAYWWNSSDRKNNSVRLKLRDLRPRNSGSSQQSILHRLAVAAAENAKKNGDLKEYERLQKIADCYITHFGLLGEPEIIRTKVA